MYSARLVAILDAYLNSRHVDRDYDSLTQLLVCDRIKSTLPEGCLKHILAIESSTESGWLKVHELAEAVDLYFANSWQHGDRPRAGALGIPSSTRVVGGAASSNRPLPQVTARPPDSLNGKGKASDTRTVAAPSESSKRCFAFGSKYHLKNECPDRNKLGQARANTKVNACHRQTQTELAATHITLRPSDETVDQ